MQVSQVKKHASSLNHGDVFILDAGMTIYEWIGKKANVFEKTKGMQCANRIRDDERGSKAKIIKVVDGSEDGTFWKLTGGSKSDVKSAASAGDDKAHEKKKLKTLYQ